LADFAHCTAHPIGDYVRGHRGAAFAVALIDVLDDLLALVAARQIDIDVGPFTALFGKETLEQQFHSHRIDRSDSQRITNCRIRRRSTTLSHDPMFPAELHDVPD